jgi:transcriptional regulator with XRE-family HTH domain
MDNLHLFGKRVKELRKSKGITQEKLAEIIELDAKQIGNIETGSGFTTMQTLEKLANFLMLKLVICSSFRIKNPDNNDLKTISKIINAVLK